MDWTFLYLMVGLKIPLLAALWLIWYAVREPEEEQAPDEDRGGRGGGPHPRNRPPKPPRRGPHAEPPPPAPLRVRVARGRRVPAK